MKRSKVSESPDIKAVTDKALSRDHLMPIETRVFMHLQPIVRESSSLRSHSGSTTTSDENKTLFA